MATFSPGEAWASFRELLDGFSRWLREMHERESREWIEMTLRENSAEAQRIEAASPQGIRAADAFGRRLQPSLQELAEESAGTRRVLEEMTSQRGSKLREELMTSAWGRLSDADSFARSYWEEAGDVPLSVRKYKAYFDLEKSLYKASNDPELQDYEKGQRAWLAGEKFRESMDKERERARSDASLRKEGNPDPMGAYAGYMGVFDPYWQKYAKDLKSYYEYEDSARKANEVFRKNPGPEGERLKQGMLEEAYWRYMQEEAESRQALAKTLAQREKEEDKARREYYTGESAPFKEYLKDADKWSDTAEREDRAFAERVRKGAGRYTDPRLWSRGPIGLAVTSLWSQEDAPADPLALEWSRQREALSLRGEAAVRERLVPGDYEALRALIKEARGEKGDTAESLAFLKEISRSVAGLMTALEDERNRVRMPGGNAYGI